MPHRHRSRTLVVAAALMLACSMLWLPSPGSATAIGGSSARQAVYDGFYNTWLPLLDVPTGWTGNPQTCTDNGPSSAGRQASLDAVNYFRDLAGLAPVAQDATANGKAQQAALMMAAESALSHSPGTGWACYTSAGADGAGHSNLALGATGPEGIRLFLDDPGAGNKAAGHRRWLLDPGQQTMGFGVVGPSEYSSAAMAVWVLNPGVDRANLPALIGWPAAGYFPVQFEPGGRWSVSVTNPDWDLSNARVSLTGPAGLVAIKQQPLSPGYGLPTLVFELGRPVPHPWPGPANDATYTVTVSGITDDGSPVGNQSYSTTLIQTPTAWPDDPWVDLQWERGYESTGGVLSASAWWGGQDVDETWSWQRDGQTIAGARGSTYTTTAADVNHKIRAVVVGRNPDYNDKTLTTTAAAVRGFSAAAPFTNRTRPTISGKTKVGRVLSASTGTWNHRLVTVRYQWFRGAKAIKGGTARKHRLVRADRGKKLRVRVTVMDGDGRRLVAWSKWTRKVRR